MLAVKTDAHPSLGIAYSSWTPSFLRDYPDAIDHVEIPFERLCCDPSVIEICSVKPIVLHCASLSIAGSVEPSQQVVSEINEWIHQTNTPWLGEHLSFITAERQVAGLSIEERAPDEPFNISYSVSPPLNEESIERVLRSITFCQQQFNVPLLLENPPVYFEIPGSSMTQVEFIRRICERSSVGLLLDLTHFLITCLNTGMDPRQEILTLPLSRVVEIHLSGIDYQEGVYWDNHASQVPEIVLELLAIVLSRAKVKAITFEYNWFSPLPISTIVDQIHQVRKTLIAQNQKAI